jgi:transcriptional regulator with XRE-family HTH domain
MTRLTAFIRRVMEEKGLEPADVASRSRQAIKYATVYSIINERQKDISLTTLIALADGLGVPVEEIAAAAAGKKRDGRLRDNIEFLTHKFDQLTDAQQESLKPLLDLLDRELERLLTLKGDAARLSSSQAKGANGFMLEAPPDVLMSDPNRGKRKSGRVQQQIEADIRDGVEALRRAKAKKGA